MSVILTARNETQNFSEYSNVDDAGSHLSITGSAALAGTSYGLQAVVDDTTLADCWGDFTVSTDFRARFYIDPNSVGMASVNRSWGFLVGYQMQTGGGTWYNFMGVDLFHFWGSGYAIRAMAVDDSGVEHNPATDITITDAPHYIEVWAHRATGAATNDGYVRIWVDGVEGDQITGLDNYNNMLDYAPRWKYATVYKDLASGAAGGIVYLDELVVNNDGSEIGPYVPPATGIIVNLELA